MEVLGYNMVMPYKINGYHDFAQNIGTTFPLVRLFNTWLYGTENTSDVTRSQAQFSPYRGRKLARNGALFFVFNGWRSGLKV